jgi:hypothetical protein
MRQLKRLGDRKWHETAVGAFVVVLTMCSIASYAHIVTPWFAIGCAAIVVGGFFANRLDVMDKQITWLLERERERRQIIHPNVLDEEHLD